MKKTICFIVFALFGLILFAQDTVQSVQVVQTSVGATPTTDIVDTITNILFGWAQNHPWILWIGIILILIEQILPKVKSIPGNSTLAVILNIIGKVGVNLWSKVKPKEPKK